MRKTVERIVFLVIAGIVGPTVLGFWFKVIWISWLFGWNLIP